MKDFFDMALILFISLTMFVCMMFFSEEVAVQQEAIHLRNRIVEIMEIENGYTSTAKSKVNELISKSNREIIVNVDKMGTLEYGDEVDFEVNIYYQRRLPFNISSSKVRYVLNGEYYNVNG